MKTVLYPADISFREKGSKFIGYLFPVTSKASFDAKLEELKSAYPDATHHCYAWRIDPLGPEEFAQDDGEPGGTAGLPILNQLKSFEAVNAAVVVVRYFGGTKLGKAGLIEAYTKAARLCLEEAQLAPIRLIQKVKLRFPYSEQGTVETLIHQFNLTELESTYLEDVSLTLGCPAGRSDAFISMLKQLEHRGISSVSLGKDYI